MECYCTDALAHIFLTTNSKHCLLEHTLVRILCTLSGLGLTFALKRQQTPHTNNLAHPTLRPLSEH